jgi:ERCC4-type nuclease
MTKAELAEMLERLVGDAPSSDAWEFDDFTSVKASFELEPYRQRIMEAWGDGWNDAAEIRNIVRELRTDA